MILSESTVIHVQVTEDRSIFYTLILADLVRATVNTNDPICLPQILFDSISFTL